LAAADAAAAVWSEEDEDVDGELVVVDPLEAEAEAELPLAVAGLQTSLCWGHAAFWQSTLQNHACLHRLHRFDAGVDEQCRHVFASEGFFAVPLAGPPATPAP
jgi:hypothetical protein